MPVGQCTHLIPSSFPHPSRAGDIVIPGIFLALLLRYDALTALRSGQLWLGGSDVAVKPGHGSALADTSVLAGSVFPRPYFNAGLVAYALGLAATVAVMVLWDHAQPALLYLVPAVLLTSAVMALVRGEVNSLMVRYSDEAYVNELIGGNSEASSDAKALSVGAAKKSDAPTPDDADSHSHSNSSSSKEDAAADTSSSAPAGSEEEEEEQQPAQQLQARRRVRRRD